ncbi:hypothetical protein MG293_018628 [Ovis ammon polii]|uniref:Uncharacterized protein n=1 Tax=Ovis ammon polii TaxID=230172 RepID=A0AAD4XYG9_OVIAM|nr:hypothetical protein MG293_018628 [Ovis ammon polii]
MSTCDKRVGGARRQDPGAGAGAWALPGQPAPTCRFQGDQSEKRCQRADAPRGPAATHSPASLRLARGPSEQLPDTELESPRKKQAAWGRRKPRCSSHSCRSQSRPLPTPSQLREEQELQKERKRRKHGETELRKGASDRPGWTSKDQKG